MMWTLAKRVKKEIIHLPLTANKVFDMGGNNCDNRRNPQI